MPKAAPYRLRWDLLQGTYILHDMGSGRVLQWLDRLLINPILHLVAAYKTNKTFRRSILAKPHADIILGSGQEEHKGA